MEAFAQSSATRELADKVVGLSEGGVTGDVVETYLRHAYSIDDAAPEDMLGLILAHYELSRSPGDIRVRVFTPTVEADGWSSGSTVVQCVIADIPFLVDSVSSLLRARGHSIKRLIHPVVDGESWISVEIPRIPAGKEAPLARAVESVLTDVRAAVGDWGPMTDLVRAAAERFEGGEREILTWIAEGNFTLLGAFEISDGCTGSRLGLARHQDDHVAELAATHDGGFSVAKSPRRSSVHRHAHFDVVHAGELVLFGLMTAGVYAGSVLSTPLAAAQAATVIDASGLTRDSHSGKHLLQLLENYPRDILMLLPPQELAVDAARLVRPEAASSTTVLLHRDVSPGAIAGVVVVPRDRFDAHVTAALARIAKRAFPEADIETQVSVGNGPLAFLSFIAYGTGDAAIDETELARHIEEATRDWNEDFAAALRLEFGEDASPAMFERYRDGIPASYRAQYSARVAASDMRHVDELGQGEMRLSLYRPSTTGPGRRRLKIFVREDVSLTRILPIFSNFGLIVTDERPYAIDGETPTRIFDFGFQAPSEEQWAGEGTRERFQEAVVRAWNGQAESDSLDALVLSASLTWRQVSILRAIVAYMRQAGLAFSRSYIRQMLVANPELAGEFVALFDARFNPATRNSEREAAIRRGIGERIADLGSLDEERTATAALAVIEGIVRTNAYQESRPTLAFKLEPRRIPFLPEPRPMFEIWVYSPRVEGVHLRFGRVARGGLRWSDRREDFRTEILGLVKAQMVKNAVIVPTGSKGGFYAKLLPPPTDRQAWLAEGTAAYALFVASLLDVTDNLVSGVATTPEGIAPADGPDPYLVVAADKGTARFSDVANEVSRRYGFWLDDAFASGGSTGFDHKAMGITARGAWESVKRHFRELGMDTQSEDFTVVGIGDMSGDVFGNGMLLSEHIRLVAAFDHRSVFLDPDPDAKTSFAERRRLFEMSTSSWVDYDASLISDGGGVWPRTAKSIPIGSRVRERLGLPEGTDALTPSETIRAILAAPVDLLWNGGIGTYVKSSAEDNGAIGDRANDPIRIDGRDLRCRVIGEGGNLGLSQLGRIEAALAGTRVNTDAIDNSAGVDTSDHEVNIKILLAEQVAAGDLTVKQRNALLESVTGDVAAHVLRDNYDQNTLLGNARALGPTMVHEHIRLMHWLEERGELDRGLEFLPSDRDLLRRVAERDRGLTSPEFAILVAYAKIALKEDLIDTSLPDDSWFARELRSYFPPQIVERYAEDLAGHPLAREIVTNSIANSVINRGGLTFVLRAMEDTQASVEDIVRAFAAAREILDMQGFVAAVEALDNRVPTDAQTELYLGFRRVLDAAVRRLIQTPPASIGQTVQRFAPLREWIGRLDAFVPEPDLSRRAAEIDLLVGQSVPEGLAATVADLSRATSLMDAIETAARVGEDPDEVVRVMFDLYVRFSIGRLLELNAALPVTDVWTASAQSATEADLRAATVALTEAVLSDTDRTPGRVEAWLASRPGASRALAATDDLAEMEEASLAPLMVGLRALRTLAGS